jgi:TolB-like protein
VRFWVEVAGWAARSGWAQFKRLPKWIRWIAYAWLIGGMISRCDSDKHERAVGGSTGRPAASSSDSSSDGSSDITAAKLEKLKAIAKKFQSSKDKEDLDKLTSEVSDAFAADDDDNSESANSLLAIAFTAPPGDESAAGFANTTFALTYGMIVISHHGSVGMNNDPVTSPDLKALLARGKESHAKYVLVGFIDQPTANKPTAAAKVLTVKIAKVADGSLVWSKSYDVTTNEPVKIAAEIDSHIPAL